MRKNNVLYSALVMMFCIMCTVQAVSIKKVFANQEFEVLYDGIRVVIFDCDGVLVDSEHFKYLAWKKALADYNVHYSLDDYMMMVGHSTDAILAMINGSRNISLPHEVIAERDKEYMRLQSQQVIPLQPMVDFVRDLANKKSEYYIKIALASSASKHEILVNLKSIGLEDVFDVIVSGEDDLTAYGAKKDVNKPKPYIYQEVARRLNVEPAACIVFEDTSAGVIAAADAGMYVVAVPNKFTRAQDFSKAFLCMDAANGVVDIAFKTDRD